MRLLYKHIDELLMAGHFDSCNELLKSFELSRVKDLLWGGLLTITFAAREKLPERARLYSKIFNRLSESRTPAKANELLQGLK